jgi:hypothetical protein
VVFAVHVPLDSVHEPSVVDPVVKLTVPVAVPLDAVTVAFNATDSP